MLSHPFEASVTHITLGSLHFKAPMATRGATKSSSTLTIGVDNYALYCMVNFPNLFDNLVLSNEDTVDGINDGLEIWERGHSSSSSGTTIVGRTTSAFPNLFMYLGWRNASYHHNIGRRWQQARRHGWVTLIIATFYFGMEARRLYHSAPQPTFQPSSQLPCTRIRHLPLHMKPWRPRSSRERQSSGFPDACF